MRENRHQCAIFIGGRDGALPAEYLPKPDQGLQRPGGVRAQAQIVDLIDSGRGVEKLIDGCVGNFGRFSEERILRAEGTKLARQPIRGVRIERCLAVAIHVAQRHENLQRLVLRRLAAKPEQGLDNVVRILPIRPRRG